jgi:tRNA 2-thiouridine synthesizing protein A
MGETTLDLRGLKCPLPVLRARKAMRALAPGTPVRVLATDPGAGADFRAMCQASGDRLEGCHEVAGEFTFLIRRAGVP